MIRKDHRAGNAWQRTIETASEASWDLWKRDDGFWLCIPFNLPGLIPWSRWPENRKEKFLHTLSRGMRSVLSEKSPDLRPIEKCEVQVLNFFRSIRKGSDVKECPRYLLDALKSNGVTGVSDSSICRVLPTLSEVDRIAWRTEIHILDLDARRRKEIERDLFLKKEGPLSSHLLEGHDGP